jgi:hypothetical protein
MGLFDFLHGNPPKSEAEQYMELRNKETARKMAAYRRKETLAAMTANNDSGLFSVLKDHAKNYSNQDSLGRVIGTAVKTAIDDSNKQYNAYRQQKANCNFEQTSRSMSSSCNVCTSQTDDCDQRESTIFIVQRSFIKPSIRAVHVIGSISRGSLAVGDKIIIRSATETNESVIAMIIRRNEKQEYANSASGEIELILANSAFIVREGDTIVKK